MAGICGVIHLDGSVVEDTAIQPMLVSLGHLGRKQQIWSTGSVAMATAGSSICAHDEALTVVADLRLDARAELRAALGSVPKAAADLTLLSAAYRKWGSECVQHIVGNFAFAIWDHRQQRLFCAVDHFGMRPLFMYRSRRSLIFASEIRAILAHPDARPTFNPKFLARIVDTRWVAQTNDQTAYRGIDRIRGAHAVEVVRGQLHQYRYWRLNPDARSKLAARDIPAALRALLFEVINDHLRDGRPVAALLSGGLDSSTIVAIAAEILRRRNQKLTAFSAVHRDGLTTRGLDEWSFVSEFSGRENVDIVRIEAPGRGPFSDLEQTLEALESPYCTSRHFLYSEFAQQAYSRGLGVLLDGAGGEFGPSYPGRGCLLELLRAGKIRTCARSLSAFTQQSGGREAAKTVARDLLSPYLRRRKSSENASFRGHHVMQQLLVPDFVQEISDETQRLATKTADSSSEVENHRHRLRRSLEALGSYDHRFAGYQLTQLRAPLIDRRLIEFCLAAPIEAKIAGGRYRALIRDAMTDLLPPRIRERNCKQAFSPDYAQRYEAQRTGVLEFLDAWPRNAWSRTIVDVAQLRTWAEMPPGPGHDGIAPEVRTSLLVPLGVCLLKFLERNFGSQCSSQTAQPTPSFGLAGRS